MKRTHRKAQHTVDDLMLDSITSLKTQESTSVKDPSPLATDLFTRSSTLKLRREAQNTLKRQSTIQNRRELGNGPKFSKAKHQLPKVPTPPKKITIDSPLHKVTSKDDQDVNNQKSPLTRN